MRDAATPRHPNAYAPLTDEHLTRLAEIASADREDRFIRLPRWAVYRDRVLLVALCQVAAVHCLDGRNGVKDLDVWTFYARHDEDPFPYRSRKMADFGPSELGRHPDDVGYTGRHVDLIGRSIDAPPGADPVLAVRTYLRAGHTTSARALAAKAAIALDRQSCAETWCGPPRRDGEASAAGPADRAVARRLVHVEVALCGQLDQLVEGGFEVDHILLVVHP